MVVFVTKLLTCVPLLFLIVQLYNGQCSGQFINQTIISENNVVLIRRALYGDELFVFRVINGKPAKIGDVPYQIALMQRRRRGVIYQSTCGGTIIGVRKILTAAHCVVKSRLSSCTSGSLGKRDFKGKAIAAGQLKTFTEWGLEGQWRHIKSGAYPSSYRFPKNDIAVLMLMTGFIFNKAVKPIKFARKLIDYKGMKCTASGYGRIDNRIQTQSEILLTAELEILSTTQCNRIHKADYSKLVCTSDEISDIHKGDSGGPLVCKNTGDPIEAGDPLGVVVGVVSGKKRFPQAMGSFFTRVASYSKFVAEGKKSARLTISSNLLFLTLFYVLYEVIL